MGLIENLVSVASALTKEVAQLRSDNQELRKESKNIYGLCTGPSGTQSPATIKECTDWSLPPQSVTSYRDMLSRNLHVRKERTISKTRNASNSVVTQLSSARALPSVKQLTKLGHLMDSS
jgi:hypothetical protein